MAEVAVYGTPPQFASFSLTKHLVEIMAFFSNPVLNFVRIFGHFLAFFRENMVISQKIEVLDGENLYNSER